MLRKLGFRLVVLLGVMRGPTLSLGSFIRKLILSRGGAPGRRTESLKENVFEVCILHMVPDPFPALLLLTAMKRGAFFYHNQTIHHP